MVSGGDDAVVVEMGERKDDPIVITVNCPDKTGLACDLSRIVLEFGLRITRADVSTDGKWCFVVIWVVPRSTSSIVRWGSLKNRLVSTCPPNSLSFYLNLSRPPVEPPMYLLKFFAMDRKGLLHDVTHVLSELELLIHRVKVSTTPDGKVVDLFFITDGTMLMHKRERQQELCSRLIDSLGESIRCELQLAEPEYRTSEQGFCLLPSSADKELFSTDLLTIGEHSGPDFSNTRKNNINLDNSLSPSYTLLQIQCTDQKGLFFDILRTLKDCNMQIAYGRLLSNSKGCREVDLFIQQNDGKKIVDPEKQENLCYRLRMEMLHPLRVTIVNRGPDAELLVANPVELSGNGRPRVFYDVTLALKTLGICIFLAEIGRHSTAERQWEVYRFRLDENPRFTDGNARKQIIDTVRKTLMGW